MTHRLCGCFCVCVWVCGCDLVESNLTPMHAPTNTLAQPTQGTWKTNTNCEVCKNRLAAIFDSTSKCVYGCAGVCVCVAAIQTHRFCKCPRRTAPGCRRVATCETGCGCEGYEPVAAGTPKASLRPLCHGVCVCVPVSKCAPVCASKCVANMIYVPVCAF